MPVDLLCVKVAVQATAETDWVMVSMLIALPAALLTFRGSIDANGAVT
ncbi:hypothetical protein [Streptomyces chrestomyceticus]